MSRIPRSQEHLKAGFTAEAAAAARYRAYASRAQKEGLPNLADHWRSLAAAKDELAIKQLEAAGKVRGEAADLVAEISDERYENDVLYPKMIREVDASTAEILEGVVAEQREHLGRLEALRRNLVASQGDVEPPAA